MPADRKTIERVLAAIPQRSPFRFIDAIHELDEQTITASYKFRSDEFFYRGHFEGNPITPGVILVETMAQAGVVALGIYQLMKNENSVTAIQNTMPLFAYMDQVEFTGIVRPKERVIVKGRKIYFRNGSIKSNVHMEKENGESVCQATLAGAGVKKNGK